MDTFKQEQLKPLAEKRLMAELILRELKNIIDADISDEQVEAELATIMSKYHDASIIEKLKSIYKPGTAHYEEIRSKLAYAKIIDTFLVEETPKK